MHDFQNKRLIKRRLYSIPALIVSVFIMVVFLKGAISVWNKHKQSEQNLAALEKSLFETREREKELEYAIEDLKTEQGVEREIRKKFSVVKPGEEMVVIVESRNSKQENSNDGSSWWQKTKDWFKDRF